MRRTWLCVISRSLRCKVSLFCRILQILPPPLSLHSSLFTPSTLHSPLSTSPKCYLLLAAWLRAALATGIHRIEQESERFFFISKGNLFRFHACATQSPGSAARNPGLLTRTTLRVASTLHSPLSTLHSPHLHSPPSTLQKKSPPQSCGRLFLWRVKRFTRLQPVQSSCHTCAVRQGSSRLRCWER